MKENKKLLAYRLTGRNRPAHLKVLEWKTLGNTNNGYDLCYLLHYICEHDGQDIIEKRNKFFKGPKFPSNNGSYGKSASKNFRFKLHTLYPLIFPID